MTRPTLEDMLLDMARVASRRATCPRLRVGAVIARDGDVLATGYNGAPAGLEHCGHPLDEPCPTAVHAETNAVGLAARNGHATLGATLYVTHAPCLPCSGLLLRAGLVGVVYAEPYRDPAGVNRLRAAGLTVRTH